MKSRFYCFCKVVELGNFTRAAEQLGYSQSAVSQMVKTLESELGATLIERRKDGIAILPIDTQPRRTMLRVETAGCFAPCSTEICRFAD